MTVEPFIKGRRGVRVAVDLHREPPTENRAHPLVCAITWAAITVGVLAIVYGSVEFFLWALSLVGRPA